MAKVTNWVIYVLKNPRTNEVRYVGWTQNPKTRLKDHRSTSIKSPTTYRARWILSLLSIGLEPVMEIIESGTGEGWPEAEQRWIAHYRATGARLVNATDGGEGRVGYPLSAASKEKIAASKRGRKLSPEHKAALFAGAVNIDRNRSPETREKIAASKRGKPRSPETIAKMAAAHRGKKLSAEVLAKLSAIRKGRKRRPEVTAKIQATKLKNVYEVSAETRAKMSAARQRSGPMPPEVRAKISAALKGRKFSQTSIAKRTVTREANGTLRGRRPSPEHRKNISEAMKRYRASLREKEVA